MKVCPSQLCMFISQCQATVVILAALLLPSAVSTGCPIIDLRNTRGPVKLWVGGSLLKEKPWSFKYSSVKSYSSLYELNHWIYIESIYSQTWSPTTPPPLTELGRAVTGLWYHSMQLNIENSSVASMTFSQSEGRTGVQVANHSRAVITLNNIEDHQGNSTEY